MTRPKAKRFTLQRGDECYLRNDRGALTCRFVSLRQNPDGCPAIVAVVTLPDGYPYYGKEAEVYPNWLES